MQTIVPSGSFYQVDMGVWLRVSLISKSIWARGSQHYRSNRNRFKYIILLIFFFFAIRRRLFHAAVILPTRAWCKKGFLTIGSFSSDLVQVTLGWTALGFPCALCRGCMRHESGLLGWTGSTTRTLYAFMVNSGQDFQEALVHIQHIDLFCQKGKICLCRKSTTLLVKPWSIMSIFHPPTI